MKKELSNQGGKYCFVCIDVFTKVAGMEPMKNKEASTCLEAFKDIIRKVG